MSKRIISLILSLCMVITMFVGIAYALDETDEFEILQAGSQNVLGLVEGLTAPSDRLSKMEKASSAEVSRIKQQISDTYAECLSRAGETSFSGLCATYVNWQLVVLGINTSIITGDGCQEFDNYKNMEKSSGGYTITAYPASSYDLYSALNIISSNGTKDVYDILVGFETNSVEGLEKYGHTCFIHAILNGTIYYSESNVVSYDDRTFYSEGTPLSCSISTFCDYYNRQCTLDGLIHFVKCDHDSDFTSKGHCGKCNSWLPNQNNNYTAVSPGIYQVISGKTAIVRERPYKVGSEIATLSSGTTIKVTGALVNGLGNIWYKVQYGGLERYVVETNLQYKEPLPITVEFTANDRQSITADNVILARNLNVSGATVAVIKKVGIEIYDSNNDRKVNYSETPSVDTQYNWMEVWYDLKAELNFTPAPGATYTYRFKATDTNNRTWYSDWSNLTLPDSFTVTFSPNDRQSVTANNVILARNLNVSGATVAVIKTVGIEIYDFNNDCKVNYSETPSVDTQYNWMEVWYDLKAELNFTPTSGAAYKYRFKAIDTNNKTWYSNWDTFGDVVSVTSVSLNRSSLTLPVDETIQLTATINPTSATNKAATWSSSAPEIASVNSNGVVTGYNSGTAIITVKTTDGNKTATCTVNVTYQDRTISEEPVETLTKNGHTYQLYTGTVAWTTAKQFCENHGGYLMTITSAEEQSIIETINTDRRKLWLGAQLINGNWTWVTGELFSYTAWSENEPSNSFFGTEGYLNAYPIRWNDCRLFATSITGFIMESENMPITITTQPKNATVVEGNNATFKVVASGTNLTYQWQVCEAGKTAWKDSPATGSKTATLTVPGTMSRNGYKYRCVVTSGSTSVTSDAATLTVTAGVKITTQPTNATVVEGNNATFKVVASGTNLTYQWQVSTNGGSSWSNSPADGNKTATLTVPGTLSRNGYKYRCVVKSGSNSVTSNAATLTVTSGGLKITTQPVSVTMAAGGSATFKVVASGTNLSYQWQVCEAGKTTWKDSPATGSKTATLTVPATASRNGYKYRCVVKSGTSSVTSSAATLTVVAVTTQPKSVTQAAGSTATFTVKAQGPNLTYQWQVSTNGGNSWSNSPAEGNKTATLTVPVTASRNGYRYRCVVKSGSTTVTSDAATLTVS